MKRAALIASAAVAGIALLPFAPGVTAARAAAANAAAPADAGTNPDPAAASAVTDGPPGVISSTIESYAMRVEYDIPLPAGSGNVAGIAGEARRSQAGENAKGLAAAPTALDAVVGGTYVDPQKTGKPERGLPQTECFYPGSLVDTRFTFPTDTQAETKPVPAIGYATAHCDAGPMVELHAVDQSVGGKGTPTESFAPYVESGAVTSEGLARPVKDTLLADTASRASNISILNGALKVGSVVASGHSQTTGKAGGATTTASVSISDIEAGGQRFSLSSASVDGKEQVQITAAGQTVPVDSSAGKAVLDAVNAGLEAQGCSITPLTTPDRYPQGFLFARPAPDMGVKPDGTLASSYRGGLLVTCDIPRAASDPTTFTPQRMQLLLGFAWTSTAATGEPLGFGLGDLGFDSGPITGGLGATSAPLGSVSSSATGLASSTGASFSGTAPATATAAAGPSGAATAPAAAPATQQARPAALIKPFHMDAADKWLIGVLAVIVWAALTHVGARRFLLAIDDSAAAAAQEG